MEVKYSLSSLNSLYQPYLWDRGFNSIRLVFKPAGIRLIWKV